MLKIAIDGRPLQGQLTGVGKYVLQIILAFVKYIPNCQITIFTNRELGVTFSEANIVVKYDHGFKRMKPLIWSKFFLGRLLKKEPFDFYFFGGTFSPIQKLAGKKIVVVHDLNHIYVKETMSKLHFLTHLLFFKKDVIYADFIVANSHGTALKLKTNCDINADFILHPPIDESYRVIGKEELREVLDELSINFDYILTVATQEPRKNLDKTIKTYIELKKQQELPECKLLLIGAKGWKDEKLQLLVNSDRDVIQMGYVAEKYLPYLYNGAASFVFPSKYEGYGMPATEAVLCGLKPVVTNITELREATLDNAFFIDPEAPTEFARGILDSFANRHERAKFDDIALRERFSIEFKGFLRLLNIDAAC